MVKHVEFPSNVLTSEQEIKEIDNTLKLGYIVKRNSNYLQGHSKLCTFFAVSRCLCYAIMKSTVLFFKIMAQVNDDIQAQSQVLPANTHSIT